MHYVLHLKLVIDLNVLVHMFHDYNLAIIVILAVLEL